MLGDRQAAAEAIVDRSLTGFSRAALPLSAGGSVTWPLAPKANRLGLRLNPELTRPLHARELLEQLGQRGWGQALERAPGAEMGPAESRPAPRSQR